MIDPVLAIGAARNGFEMIKEAWELLRLPDLKRTEIEEKLNGIHRAMSDMQVALDDAGKENARLEARIAELTRWADFAKDFKFGDGVYWREGAPYCPVCFEVDHKPTRLGGPWRAVGDIFTMEHWNCPFHNSEFQTLNRR